MGRHSKRRRDNRKRKKKKSNDAREVGVPGANDIEKLVSEHHGWCGCLENHPVWLERVQREGLDPDEYWVSPHDTLMPRRMCFSGCVETVVPADGLLACDDMLRFYSLFHNGNGSHR